MATRRDKQERRRGNRRENRHERRQQQHSGGGGEWDAIRVPEGLEVFRPEASTTYHIDIIPYIVGDHNKNADKGDEYFELSYACYKNLGIDEKTYIAIGDMFGMKDPVAEHFARLRRGGSEWEDMKDFKPKWRQLMLVFVHEQAERGLQFFEGSYKTFGELLDEEIAGEEEEYIENFDDPDGGATLVVRFKAQDIGQTNKWVKASKINFEKRENGFDADGDDKLAAEVLALAGKICLDDCLKVPDYATLAAALNGEPVVGADEAPAPSREPRRGRKPAPEPEEDGDDDEEDTVPFDEEDEEDEEPVKPRSKTAPVKSKAKAKPAPEPEEDGDDDEEAPAPKKAPKVDADDDWDEDWED